MTVPTTTRQRNTFNSVNLPVPHSPAKFGRNSEKKKKRKKDSARRLDSRTHSAALTSQFCKFGRNSAKC